MSEEIKAILGKYKEAEVELAKFERQKDWVRASMCRGKMEAYQYSLSVLGHMI